MPFIINIEVLVICHLCWTWPEFSPRWLVRTGDTTSLLTWGCPPVALMPPSTWAAPRGHSSAVGPAGLGWHLSQPHSTSKASAQSPHKCCSACGRLCPAEMGVSPQQSSGLRLRVQHPAPPRLPVCSSGSRAPAKVQLCPREPGWLCGNRMTSSAF